MALLILPCLVLASTTTGASSASTEMTTLAALAGEAFAPLITLSADSEASGVLAAWAISNEQKGGATFGEAVARERAVVERVNGGQWPAEAYSAYQYLTASRGQLDSGHLLLQYGIYPAVLFVMDHAEEYPLHAAAARGDLAALRAGLRGHGNSIYATANEDEEGDGADEEHGGDHAAKNHVNDSAAATGVTALHCACLAENEEVAASAVTLLLAEGGADVEAVSTSGATPLMVAAMAGRPTVLRALLQFRDDGEEEEEEGGASVDVNAKHPFAGNTALHFASESFSAEAVRVLCEYGANVEAMTDGTLSAPLFTAIDTNNAAKAAALLAPPCSASVTALMNGDTSALYLAASNGFHQVVEVLLKAGADPNFAMPDTGVATASTGTSSRQLLSSRDDGVAFGGDVAPVSLNTEVGVGAQPLHAAAENGHLRTLRALIRGGADVNSISMGVTPLMLTAQYGRAALVMPLVRAGAEVEARSELDGSTALYSAAGLGFVETVEVLLGEANADPSATQRRSGATPLLYAAAMGHVEVVQLLMKSVQRVESSCGGGGLWLTDDEGNTPLHLAAERRQWRVVQALVKAGGGALTGLGLAAGAWALHTAALDGGPVVVVEQLIGSAEVDVNAWEERKGGTPLHSAIRGAAAAAAAAAAGDKKKPRPRSNSDESSSSEDVIRLLLAAGANVSLEMAPSHGSATPLLLAIDGGLSSVVQLLLSEGRARPDQRAAGGQGMLPLLLAVRRGKEHMVEALLLAGAECDMLLVTSQGGEPQSLLDIARAHRHYGVMQLLADRPECSSDDADEEEGEAEL